MIEKNGKIVHNETIDINVIKDFIFGHLDGGYTIVKDDDNSYVLTKDLNKYSVSFEIGKSLQDGLHIKTSL